MAKAKRKNTPLCKEGEFWKERATELNARCLDLVEENIILSDALRRSQINYPEQFETRADLH